MTKSRKRTKGIGQLHDEVKKQVSLMLTPEAWQRLAVKAEERGLSRSEFIEQVARGLIPLVDTQAAEVVSLDNSDLTEQQVSVSSPDVVAQAPVEVQTQPEQQNYNSEFPLDWKTLHISDWQQLPNQPGIYGVVYSDRKIDLDDVYTYESQYRLYKPNKIRIRYSQDIRKQLKYDLDHEREMQEVINSFTKVEPFAYLVWAEISETDLMPQIRDTLIDFCRQAIDLDSLSSLQREKSRERKKLSCNVMYCGDSTFLQIYNSDPSVAFVRWD